MLFALDCAGARDGVVEGKFLDAIGNVLRPFNEQTGELQPTPAASKVDAVAKAICAAGGNVWRGRCAAPLPSSGSGLQDLRQ